MIIVIVGGEGGEDTFCFFKIYLVLTIICVYYSFVNFAILIKLQN